MNEKNMSKVENRFCRLENDNPVHRNIIIIATRNRKREDKGGEIFADAAGWICLLASEWKTSVEGPIKERGARLVKM